MSEDPTDPALDEVEAAAAAGSGTDGDPEIVDGLLVLAEPHDVRASSPSSVPVARAAALAAGGFFAGALTMALAKRYAAHRLAETAAAHLPAVSRLPQPTGSRPTWPAPGETRTFLVTVRTAPRPAPRAAGTD